MPRSSVLAWHRWVILGVVVVLAALTYLFLRGPDAWQRIHYPLPDEYRPMIAASAQRHKVNPYLVAAIIQGESKWRPDAVSEAGAVGLMQLLPTTANDLKHLVEADFEPTADGLLDPATNIEYGTAYIRLLVERYHEIEPALAAYNAGMRNVDEWIARGDDIRDTIEFPETRHYVLRVMRAKDAYERLYPGVFE